MKKSSGSCGFIGVNQRVHSYMNPFVEKNKITFKRLNSY